LGKEDLRPTRDLPIAGFALDGNKWDGGRRDGKDLIYAGKVDHGFDKTSAAELRKRLTPLIRKTQPYSKRIAHKGIWVEPELLAEIEYRAKSAEGKMRHPFLRISPVGPPNFAIHPCGLSDSRKSSLGGAKRAVIS
jgi:ATP-dependent DNA ligase